MADFTRGTDWLKSKNFGKGIDISSVLFDPKAETMRVTFHFKAGGNWKDGATAHWVLTSNGMTCKKFSGEVQTIAKTWADKPALSKPAIVAFTNANIADLAEGVL